MRAEHTDSRVVDGRYALQDFAGARWVRDGLGAHDKLLQRDVAIKEMELPAILDDAERDRIRAKVLREARATARLSHPSAVTVFDVIEDEGGPLIVMELVDAPTLSALVQRDAPLDDQSGARRKIEILDALEAAHAEGIVHRDVKPANVMVTGSGRVRLTDFGIASVGNVRARLGAVAGSAEGH